METCWDQNHWYYAQGISVFWSIKDLQSWYWKVHVMTGIVEGGSGDLESQVILAFRCTYRYPPPKSHQTTKRTVPSIVEGAMVILNQLSNRDRFLWSFSLHRPWISSSGRIGGRLSHSYDLNASFRFLTTVYCRISVHIPKQSVLHVISWANSRVMKSPFGGLNSQETSWKGLVLKIYLAC